MIGWVGLVLWLAQAPASASPSLLVRTYHPVTLEEVADTRHTHICTVGRVVYRRRQKDGDWHVTLDNGGAKVVAEIIPLIPLPPPAKGQVIEVCGITRYDRAHRWGEVHPVERWTLWTRSTP